MASTSSTNTQSTKTEKANDDTSRDAFQDAFSALVDNYFELEEEDSEDWSPCPHMTPEEEERILKEWIECNLRQLALTWGDDYVAQLQNQWPYAK